MRLLREFFWVLLIIPSVVRADGYLLHTDVWPPYINNEQQALGRAAKLMALVAAEQEKEVGWRYLPYDLAFELISRASIGRKALLGFPYFKTASRSKSVIFSVPVLTVSTKLYFNRHFMRQEKVNEGLGGCRLGRVSGYSYGEMLDVHLQDATLFASEIEALNALFAGTIDLLPMTEDVMETTLQRYFPERKELLLPLSGYSDTSTLHVIASRNEAGRQALTDLNASLERLRAMEIAGFDDSKPVQPRPVDMAQLIAVEGYPVVLGQTHVEGSQAQFYTLPQGTRVLVTEWSEQMLNPSLSDRFYKVMMGLSRVVILRGPHTGKELYVRNMHIELL